MKKAAGNLTQKFKVYVPSKRLPIYDQKRMLSKELQDFLHIYKKDTELLKVDYNYDIEAQRQKDRKGSFNEILLISFLNKCTETQLEEIMSAYMKNSKDSSAFLGTSCKKASDTSLERKSASAGSKKMTISTTSITSTIPPDQQSTTSNNNNHNNKRNQHNKNVTSVAISKSKKLTEFETNNNNSLTSSSNSSLNLSLEANNQQTTQNKQSAKLIDEMKIQKGIERVKSAQIENKRLNSLNPIMKEKLNGT